MIPGRADANPFWSIKTWQNLGELCWFHVFALFSSQFLKSLDSQNLKEMKSCRKLSFHLLWFTHKVPISNVHTRWNKTFTFYFNLSSPHCYIYWEEAFSQRELAVCGCTPVGNLFAQNCVQLLPSTLSMAIQHNLTHLTGQIPEITSSQAPSYARRLQSETMNYSLTHWLTRWRG